MEIRSSDDEEDVERERSIEETFDSLADLEDAAFQTAIEQSLRDSSTSKLSEARPAQSTDASSSSTSAIPIPPVIVESSVVVEPIVDVSVGIEAQIVDDPSAAGPA